MDEFSLREQFKFCDIFDDTFVDGQWNDYINGPMCKGSNCLPEAPPTILSCLLA